MKKSKIIQFSLVIVGIILFFFTYYSDDKNKIDDLDKEASIEEVDQLTEESIGHNDVSAKPNRGIQYQQEGKYKEAIDVYNRVLEASAVNWVQYSVHYNAGLCFMEIGDYNSAIKHFDKMKNVYSSGAGNRKYYHNKETN